MKAWHELLQRQLHKCFGKSFVVPKKWRCFIDEVNRTYLGLGANGAIDISERQKLYQQLRNERELVSILSSIDDINEALKHILDTAVNIEGVDSGGIYLLNPETNGLDLAVHKGLSDGFIGDVSHFSVDSPRTRLVRAGKPVYTGYNELKRHILGNNNPNEKNEGLRAMAVIPVVYEGKVVASINLASHKNDEIPIETRETLEAFAILVAGAIARMHVEEARRDMENRYHSLFEEARDAIVVADAKSGIILEVNREAENLFKRSRNELIGIHQSQLHPPEDAVRYQKIFADHVKAGGSAAMEAELITGEGRRVPVEIIASVLDLRDGKKIIRGSFRDITERKRAERELREAKKVLENWNLKLAERMGERTRELEHSKEKLARNERLSILGQMAASLSHELRTPVTVIKNSLYYLRQIKFGKTDKKTSNHLALIEQQIDSCVQTMNNILNFARPKDLMKREVDLKSVLEESLAKIDMPANINLRVEVSGDVSHVMLDPSRIEQVFINMIKNARQAMEKGGELSITINAFDDKISIEFKDSGCGIKDDDMTKLFDPLFSTSPCGTGLGLPVCLQIIEAHGGTIEVESKCGRGSLFKIVLPKD